ncbi:MAG: lytic transglycosylase domain-containing protein [Alphaproteobacteria bacterium]|nr:lytic transglycosylase domain-containing protein [Alphaproteobacteria bacterium]
MPAILTAADVARYRAIFALQAGGHWSAADREIAALDDGLLLGHVLSQRYLHRSSRASYRDLLEWLAEYADEPAAQAVYDLALKHQTRSAAALRKPSGTPLPLRGFSEGPPDLRPPAHASASVEAARAKLVIRRLARTDPAVAEQVLQRGEAEQLFDDADYDEARADIAEGYLFAGENQKAKTLASAARTTSHLPLAHWDAGLAAWRLGRYEEARGQFETLARTPGLSHWSLSAAAFWAARTQERMKRPDRATPWLRLAAAEAHTFYGLLARRMLGIATEIGAETEAGTEVDLGAVTGIPAVRRALALLQLGEVAAAEQELRLLAGDAPATLYPALATLADRGNMPTLSIQLGAKLSEIDGRRHDHALFPLPRWEPQQGFAVDRALLFALMRQESQFLPAAESQAGAVGLMQLMPETAQAMADRLGLSLAPRGKSGDLNDPRLNVTLGQEFVLMLLDHEQIKGNLILFAAAYNSGPANLLRWHARPEYRDDPLLFLESMPSRETRVFVERVMTNYWLYRQRLGQPTLDLHMLAAGTWPVYVALDTPSFQVVGNATAR